MNSDFTLEMHANRIADALLVLACARLVINQSSLSLTKFSVINEPTVYVASTFLRNLHQVE